MTIYLGYMPIAIGFLLAGFVLHLAVYCPAYIRGHLRGLSDGRKIHDEAKDREIAHLRIDLDVVTARLAGSRDNVKYHSGRAAELSAEVDRLAAENADLSANLARAVEDFHAIRECSRSILTHIFRADGPRPAVAEAVTDDDGDNFDDLLDDDDKSSGDTTPAQREAIR